MFKILVCFILLSLALTGCSDAPEAITELAMALEVIDARGSDPMLVRAHIENVGNTKTVSRGGCWLVGFSLTDADGNIVPIIDPCVVALIDCAEVVVELFPLQHHQADLQIPGIVYEVHNEETHFWCEGIPMEPGEYTVTASFAYRTADMGSEESSRVVSATTTFTWNP